MRASEFLIENKQVVLTESHCKIVLGINESFNKSQILQEQQLYESFLDSIAKTLGSKAKKTAAELSSAIKNAPDAGILIRDLISNEKLLTNASSQIGKWLKSAIKNMKLIFDQIIGKLPDNVKEKLQSFRDSFSNFINRVFKIDGWKGFLSKLGFLAVIKYIQKKFTDLKMDIVVDFVGNQLDQLTNMIEEFVKIAFSSTITFPIYLKIFKEVSDIAMILFEILSTVKRKFDSVIVKLFNRDNQNQENSTTDQNQPITNPA